MGTPNLKTPHIGRKVERIRELKGMKQDTLATKLGLSQQTISRLEASEEIEEAKLKKIADALEVSVEAIKGFNEEAVINHMNNIHNNNDSSVNAVIYYQLSPIEKITELYERLLKEANQKIAALEAKLKEGKK
jgi:transcriptional regulator with XRE-family HTH domain